MADLSVQSVKPLLEIMIGPFHKVIEFHDRTIMKVAR